MIGTKLAHFEVASHLGTGGMDEMVRCIRKRLRNQDDKATTDNDRANADSSEG